MSKYREEQLFLSQRGDISFGKTTSAGAESGNNILKPIRKLEMTSGLLLFHKKEYLRMLEVFTVVCKKTDSIICPRAMNDLKDKKEKNVLNVRKVMTVTNEFIELSSSRVGGMFSSYKISRKDWSCSCKEIQITGKPCQHSIQGAELLGHDPILLYNEPDHVKQRIKQYRVFEEDDVDWEVHVADVKELGPSDEQGPITLRYPKGRPKNRRRLKSVVEIKSEEVKNKYV